MVKALIVRSMEGMFESVRKKLDRWFCHPAKDVFSIYILLVCLSIYPFIYASQKDFFQDAAFWGIDYRLLLLSAQTSGYTLGRYMKKIITNKVRTENRGWIFLQLAGAVSFSLLLFTIVSAPLHFPFLIINGCALGIIHILIFRNLNGIKPVEVLSFGFSMSFIFLS